MGMVPHLLSLPVISVPTGSGREVLRKAFGGSLPVISVYTGPEEKSSGSGCRGLGGLLLFAYVLFLFLTNQLLFITFFSPTSQFC